MKSDEARITTRRLLLARAGRGRVLGSIMFLAVVAAVLVLALCACGGSSGKKETYSGFEPRDSSELSTFVEKAVELAKQRESEDKAAGGAASGRNAKVAEYFDRGNELYESRAAESEGDQDAGSGAASQADQEASGEAVREAGDGASGGPAEEAERAAADDSSQQANGETEPQTASSCYELALKEAPLHRGANVNLALAYLAEGNAEQSFTQALACLYLFPDTTGCILNAQAAGTACHFSEADITGAVREVLTQNGSNGAQDTLDMIDKDDWEFDGAYEYNIVWNKVETIMNEVSRGEKTMDGAYEELSAFCAELEEKSPDDLDVRYLKAFVDALAVQAGMQ